MKKNIWIFHHYAVPPCMNGLTRPYNFGKKLIEKGYNIKVFSSAFLHYSGENLIDDKSLYIEREYDGVPFVFVRTTPYTNNGTDRVKNMFSFFFNMKKTAKLLAKKYGNPDVIYASSPHLFTMLGGIQLAKKFKVECICEVRDLWPEAVFTVGKCKEDSIMGKCLKALEHRIYRKSNKLVFTKEGDVDYIKENKWDTGSGGDIDLKNAYYINNGVDIELYNNQIVENTLDDTDLSAPGKFNVIYIGAIRTVNNVGNLLDCAKLIDNKNIQFIIYGEGNELDELKQRTVNEQIENVIFKGYVDRKYVPYILSKSDLNILNYSATKYNWSRGNSSNKLFEYMASGSPVVSTVKMGYSIIEKYNCGYEVDEPSPQKLADAIIKCYDMPENERKMLGENGKSGAKDFDFGVLTDKLVKVIEK